MCGTLLCLLLAIAGAWGQSSTQRAATAPAGPKFAEEEFKNIQALKGIPAEQVIPSMQFIAASLGVECEYCHVAHANEKDDKKPKVTARKMAPKTVEIARYNAARYLAGWKNRSLREIGSNRLGLRQLGQRITREYGPATSNQCVRLLSAVYRWHRDVDDTLPEWSRKAAELHAIPARRGTAGGQ